MSGGVFISYRREDSAGFAGRIYDRLTRRLDPKSVFLDVDNIQPGLDFFDVLLEKLSVCDALVAVIGKNWNSNTEVDRRRLDDPDDLVRIEIEAALGRGILVIPVLVDGATMPRTDDLPESLKKLARRQAIEISHNSFDSGTERLTHTLTLILEAPLPPASSKTEGAAAPTKRKQVRMERLSPPKEPQDAKAASRYRLAADRGDADGQANLASFYENGHGGLPKDYNEAVRLYRLAAEQGNAKGQAGLGTFYAYGLGGMPNDDHEAARLFKLAAAQGGAWGQAGLGSLYADGRGGLPKDDREAARLCKLSADQGDAGGQVNLGILYQYGRGRLTKGHRRAARLYKLAANQGDAGGQFRLGLFYETGGGGVPKDVSEAVRLYRLTAGQGDDEAQAALKRLRKRRALNTR